MAQFRRSHCALTLPPSVTTAPCLRCGMMAAATSPSLQTGVAKKHHIGIASAGNQVLSDGINDTKFQGFLQVGQAHDQRRPPRPPLRLGASQRQRSSDQTDSHNRQARNKQSIICHNQTSRTCFGIGTKYFQKLAVVAQFGNGFGNRRIITGVLRDQERRYIPRPLTSKAGFRFCSD
jgi:hypothetical protein